MTSPRTARWLVALALGGCVAVFGRERDAEACGGCFIPTEIPTVVTDHRMILSIAKTQSTLYDQIRYTGSPASFAWVLPYSGEVTLGISSDVVFSALDQLTQTQILQPPRNCPPQPADCPSALNSPSASAGRASEDGVNVLKREVVGPYEVAYLAATDPTALRTWLAKNGFNVPADVAPVVDTYVKENFNFIALKLVPGKGVQDMRPVRVTTQGPNVALPLRMVAAGTGPVVGISLWVVGEGRYEPQNFVSFRIPTDEIAWDWTQNKSNYTDLRAQRTAASNGRGWELESSVQLPRGQITSIVEQGVYTGSGPYPQTDEERAATSYLPVSDPQGTVTKTALQVRTEDLAILFAGVPGDPRVTRLRADLAHAALDTDLLLSASADQSLAENVRQLTRESNQPLCPVWNGCESTTTAPRDEAISRSSTSASDGETFSCTTTKPTSNRTWFGLGVAAIGLAEITRRRTFRKRG